MRGQGLRNQSAHTQLMELTLCLQQTTEDYTMQLETRCLQQDLEQEKQLQAGHQGAESHPRPLNVPWSTSYSLGPQSLELHWTLGVMLECAAGPMEAA